MDNKQNKINNLEDKMRKEIDNYDDEYVNHLILTKNKEIAGKEATISANGLLCSLLLFSSLCVSFASSIIFMILLVISFIPSVYAVVDLIKIQKDKKYLKLLNEKQVKSYKEFRESLENKSKQNTVTNQKTKVKTSSNVVENTIYQTNDLDNNLEL